MVKHNMLKTEKLVYLVGFITRIYHDARSHERENKVNILLCFTETRDYFVLF